MPTPCSRVSGSSPPAPAWRCSSRTRSLGDRVGYDDFFNRYLYNALILLALAACAYRAAHRDREQSAWIALTVAVAFWAVAEILFDFAYGADPPYPSAADAFYLAFYPACYVGLMLLVRSRLSQFGRTLWFDGATAAIASAALGAAVLFEVVLRSTDGSTGVIVVNLAYPLGDILLLAAVIGVFALTGWRPGRTWLLIGAGLAATALADAIFLFQSATGSYSEGTILDALWPAVDAPPRCRGLAAGGQDRRRARGPAAARDPARLRPDRPRDLHLRPLPAAEPPGGKPGGRDDHRRDRSHGAELSRELHASST